MKKQKTVIALYLRRIQMWRTDVKSEKNIFMLQKVLKEILGEKVIFLLKIFI